LQGNGNEPAVASTDDRQEGNMIDLEDFAFELECAAEWRHQSASPRSRLAGDLLARLAREVRALKTNRVRKLLDDALKAALEAKFYNIEGLNAYRRQIGFTEFPRSGEEYLEKVIRILKAPIYERAVEGREARPIKIAS
jgi:hypothetical protein